MARDSKRRFGSGSQQVDPYAEKAGDDAPVDIAAVRRDDALIDAIAGDGPVATDSTDEYQLASLLANWRAEITAPPLPAAPDMDEIYAAVDREIAARDARNSGGHKLRLVRPIAGAAAVIALITGAMTAVSYNAQPGDPLWKIKEVVFTEQANSTVANSDTKLDLQQAELLLASGNTTEAKTYLDRASERVGDVKDDAARDDLVAKWEKLTAELRKKLAPQPADTSTTTTPTTVATAVDESSAVTTPQTTPAPQATTAPGPQLPFELPPEVVSIIPTFPQAPPASATPDPSVLLAPSEPEVSATQPPVTPAPSADPTTTAGSGG